MSQQLNISGPRLPGGQRQTYPAHTPGYNYYLPVDLGISKEVIAFLVERNIDCKPCSGYPGFRTEAQRDSAMGMIIDEQGPGSAELTAVAQLMTEAFFGGVRE